jgi:hypothetical protein
VQLPKILSFTCKPGRIEPGSAVTLLAAFDAGPDAKAYASSSGFAGVVQVENGKPVQSPPFKDPGRTADFSVVLTVSSSAGQVSRTATVRVVSSGIVFRGAQ